MTGGGRIGRPEAAPAVAVTQLLAELRVEHEGLLREHQALRDAYERHLVAVSGEREVLRVERDELRTAITDLARAVGSAADLVARQPVPRFSAPADLELMTG